MSAHQEHISLFGVDRRLHHYREGSVDDNVLAARRFARGPFRTPVITDETLAHNDPCPACNSEGGQSYLLGIANYAEHRTCKTCSGLTLVEKAQ